MKKTCRDCTRMYEDDCCVGPDGEPDSILIPYCGMTDLEIEDVDAENDCVDFY